MTRAPEPQPDGLPLWRLGAGADPLPDARRFVATVPGAEAPLIALTLPPTLRGQARVQVARRQVQDRLGLDALALWPLMTAPDWTHAVVVAPDRLQAWRQQAEAAGKACVAILPDYLALPVAQGLWTLEARDGMLRARLGAQDGLSAETDLALAMLARAAPAPRAILLTGEALDAGSLPHGVPLVTDPAELPADLRPRGVGGPVLGVDLATDPASDPVAPLARSLRAALVPSVLALIAAASWSAATLIETRRDLDAADALRQAVTQAARADILPSGPIIDLRAQVLRAVDARRAAARPQTQDSALSVLRRASAGLAGLEVLRLTMGADPAVTARVQAPDFATLERALQVWEQTGLRAETRQSGTSATGGVTAEVHIASGGQP